MAVIVNKEIFKDLDEQSSKSLFEVVTYIELFKNSRNQIFFSISNILDFFAIRNTARKIQDVKSSVEYLLSIGVIESTEVITNQYKSILYHVMSDVGIYTYYEHDAIYDLYEDILASDVGFRCGLFYYYVTHKMWRNSDGTFEDVSLSYSKTRDETHIGSKSTLSKYITFLSEKGYITVTKRLNENGHTYNVFKVLK